MNGPNAIIQESKAVLRQRMSRIRGELPDEQRVRLSRMACAHAEAWLAEQNLRSMLVYVSFRSELDTTPLIEAAWQAGIEVYAPRCRQEDSSMTIHRLNRWDELSAGAYGIREPDPAISPAAPESDVPDAVFVPGLAFDLAGGRLGYGGGYYDRLHERLVARISKHGIKPPVWAGIGFGVQVVKQVPMETTDARLQVLITEQDVYRMNEEADDGTDAF